MKRVFFFIVLNIMVACGQRSTIKNAVAPRTTAQAYGDGTYTILPIVVPLSEQMISSFDSPVPNAGFIFGGIAKGFMDMGAGMGMGRVTKLTLIQPFPKIPEGYLAYAKIKRLFFYIEPKKGPRNRNPLEKFFFGKQDVNFDFLDKFAVKLSNHNIKSTLKSWAPSLNTEKLNKKDYQEFLNLFKEGAPQMLVKYEDETNKRTHKTKDEALFYVLKTARPVQTRRFLMDHPSLKGFFKRIHLLNQSVLVELEKDPMVEENFEVILSENSLELEKAGITLIDQCKANTCLDFNVAEVNLVPYINSGNAIKMEAFISTDKVPESFQLKGFVEFEVKLKLSF